jgi:hypothetical protein
MSDVIAAGYIVHDTETIHGTASEPAPHQVNPWRHTIPATAALLALFATEGGKCEWFIRSGIACTRAEFCARYQPGASDIVSRQSFIGNPW